MIWKANPMLSRGNPLKFAENLLDFLPNGKSWRLQIISKSFQILRASIICEWVFHELQARQSIDFNREPIGLGSKSIDFERESIEIHRNPLGFGEHPFYLGLGSKSIEMLLKSIGL